MSRGATRVSAGTARSGAITAKEAVGLRATVKGEAEGQENLRIAREAVQKFIQASCWCTWYHGGQFNRRFGVTIRQYRIPIRLHIE